MPVRLLGGGERPNDPIPTHALAHVKIVGHISGVIVVDKWMLVDRVIQDEGHHHDEQTQNQVALVGRSEESLRLGRRGNRFSRGRWQQKNLTTPRPGDTGPSGVAHLFGHVQRLRLCPVLKHESFHPREFGDIGSDQC